MRKKINVILDLDQTIISSETIKTFDMKKNGAKLQRFTYKKLDDLFYVIQRPFLQGFLDYLFANFNVAVWTAASKSYAMFIINKCILTKPGRKLDFIFFSHHCSMSTGMGKGLKGLSMLWEEYGLTSYTPDNTVIIDDNNDVKKIQRCNCIAIKPFHFYATNSENDKEFIKITQKLEEIKFLFGKSVCLAK